MSWMYHALLHLQQRTRGATPRPRPATPAGGVRDPAVPTDDPGPTSRDRADASQAAQVALERAAHLLEVHHELSEPLEDLPPAAAAHAANAAARSGLSHELAPPINPAITATGPGALLDAGAVPTDVLQRLVRLLGDPPRAAPLRALAQRLASDRQATGCRTQWLVAAGPSRGVEDVALGAAACLAESHQVQGAEVLLVDADLAHRRLSRALGCDDQPGLIECLRGHRPIRGLCRPSGLAHLWVLPAGQHVDERGFQGVGVRGQAAGWGELAASFGAVLLGGGATDDPWAEVLAGLADATYVVVELGRVDKRAARTALLRLREHGARVLGCIATNGESFPT